MEPEKQIFLEAFKRIVAERGINKAVIIRRAKIGRSSLYGFLKNGRGMDDENMNRLAKYLGFDSWIALVVAEQNAEQNKGQEANTGTVSGGGKVWIDTDYVRSLEKRIDALQMLVEQHLKVHGDGRDGDLKKNRIA